MKNKRKKQSGFTLIEVLVVIGIVAILAAVVLVAINPARQFASANDSQRASNINAILNAIGQFAVDNRGDLPASVPAGGAPAAEVDAALCAELVPTYIPALPTDPASASNGAPITDCTTVAAGDVGYLVAQDAAGRVTVDANTHAQLAATIQVTR